MSRFSPRYMLYKLTSDPQQRAELIAGLEIPAALKSHNHDYDAKDLIKERIPYEKSQEDLLDQVEPIIPDWKQENIDRKGPGRAQAPLKKIEDLTLSNPTEVKEYLTWLKSNALRLQYLDRTAEHLANAVPEQIKETLLKKLIYQRADELAKTLTEGFTTTPPDITAFPGEVAAALQAIGPDLVGQATKESLVTWARSFCAECNTVATLNKNAQGAKKALTDEIMAEKKGLDSMDQKMKEVWKKEIEPRLSALGAFDTTSDEETVKAAIRAEKSDQSSNKKAATRALLSAKLDLLREAEKSPAYRKSKHRLTSDGPQYQFVKGQIAKCESLIAELDKSTTEPKPPVSEAVNKLLTSEAGKRKIQELASWECQFAFLEEFTQAAKDEKISTKLGKSDERGVPTGGLLKELAEQKNPDPERIKALKAQHRECMEGAGLSEGGKTPTQKRIDLVLQAAKGFGKDAEAQLPDMDSKKDGKIDEKDQRFDQPLSRDKKGDMVLETERTVRNRVNENLKRLEKDFQSDTSSLISGVSKTDGRCFEVFQRDKLECLEQLRRDVAHLHRLNQEQQNNHTRLSHEKIAEYTFKINALYAVLSENVTEKKLTSISFKEDHTTQFSDSRDILSHKQGAFIDTFSLDLLIKMTSGSNSKIDLRKLFDMKTGWMLHSKTKQKLILTQKMYEDLIEEYNKENQGNPVKGVYQKVKINGKTCKKLIRIDCGNTENLINWLGFMQPAAEKKLSDEATNKQQSGELKTEAKGQASAALTTPKEKEQVQAAEPKNMLYSALATVRDALGTVGSTLSALSNLVPHL